MNKNQIRKIKRDVELLNLAKVFKKYNFFDEDKCSDFGDDVFWLLIEFYSSLSRETQDSIIDIYYNHGL